MTVSDWIKWFDEQTAKDQRTIALAAVERLMEIDEVRFHPCEPKIMGLYWESCGEDLRD